MIIIMIISRCATPAAQHQSAAPVRSAAAPIRTSPYTNLRKPTETPQKYATPPHPTRHPHPYRNDVRFDRVES